MFHSIPQIVHSLSPAGYTLLLSHGTAAPLTVNKRQDSRRALTGDLSSDISVLFLFPSHDTDLEDSERRNKKKRLRSESDALHHMENKQEGNLSHREESDFLRISKAPRGSASTK